MNNQTIVQVQKFQRMHKSKTNQHGFTLIEMIVAVGLFSVVMLVSVSAILSIIGTNKKVQGINNVANNLNFAIESMVRDMKTGFLYKCDANWPINQNTIAPCAVTTAEDSVSFFSTLTGVTTPVEYRFIAPKEENGIYTPGHIVKRSGSGNPVALTPKTDIDIQSMQMYINNTEPGADSQPGILLIIRGKANILDNEVTEFGLQTFISQRILNL